MNTIGSALRPPFRYAPLRPKGRPKREETLNLNCPVKGNHLITASAAGQPWGPPVALAGKVADMTGSLMVAVDEILTDGEFSNSTKVEAAAIVVESILPAPAEAAIDNLGLPDAATLVFKGQRDGMMKASVNVVKEQTVKALDREDQAEQNKQLAESCNENEDGCNR